MTLSVIIVNFNTKTLLKNCLASLFEQTKDLDFEVWVVDNGSTDGSVEEVENLIRQLADKIKNPKVKLKLIKNKKNLGFAKANNQALRKACGKLLLLLNSDTIILDKAISKMVNFIEGNPKVGIVGAKLLNPDGSFQPSTGKSLDLWQTFLWLFGGERLGLTRFSPQKTIQTDWVSGACLMMRRRALEKIGLLDENFFMYLEEMEFCYRAKLAGFKIFFYPEVNVIHLGQRSGNRSMAIWEIYRGLSYFYKKYKPTWQKIFLQGMLKTKAALAFLFGVMTKNNYLRKTYGKAFSLAG